MTSAGGSPGRSASPTSGISLRDALIAIGVLIALLVLVELAVPSTSRASVAAVVDLVGVAAFSVTGLVAWHRRPHNATGRLMVATAVDVVGRGDAATTRSRSCVTSAELLDSLPLARAAAPAAGLPVRAGWSGGPRRVTVAAAYLVALVPPVLQDLVADRVRRDD